MPPRGTKERALALYASKSLSLNRIADILNTSLTNVRYWCLPGEKEKQNARNRERYVPKASKGPRHRNSPRAVAARYRLGG